MLRDLNINLVIKNNYGTNVKEVWWRKHWILKAATKMACLIWWSTISITINQIIYRSAREEYFSYRKNGIWD